MQASPSASCGARVHKEPPPIFYRLERMSVTRNQDVDIHLSRKSAKDVKIACGNALMTVNNANPYRWVHDYGRGRKSSVLVIVASHDAHVACYRTQIFVCFLIADVAGAEDLLDLSRHKELSKLGRKVVGTMRNIQITNNEYKDHAERRLRLFRKGLQYLVAGGISTRTASCLFPPSPTFLTMPLMQSSAKKVNERISPFVSDTRLSHLHHIHALLQAIMRYSDGTLDPRYDSSRASEEVFTTQPGLVAMLDAAWKSRSYRDIRNLASLPTMESMGIHCFESRDYEGRLWWIPGDSGLSDYSEYTAVLKNIQRILQPYQRIAK